MVTLLILTIQLNSDILLHLLLWKRHVLLSTFLYKCNIKMKVMLIK
jgi:hypothetical protein